jgi:AraC-like DNA-binding protein
MDCMRFSSRDVPEPARRDVIQDFYSSVVRMDIDACGETPLEVDMTARPTADLHLAIIECSPTRLDRTERHIAIDGNDDVSLTLPISAEFAVRQGEGDAVVCTRGEAFIGGNDSPVTCWFSEPHSVVLDVAIPRQALAARVDKLDDVLTRRVAPSPELNLLTAYATHLMRLEDSLSEDSTHLAAMHLCDLAALAVGASRDGEHVARGRGLRAARMQAIKGDVMANLANPELSLVWLAARHRLSVRYLRGLFYAEQTSFTDFVLEARLTRAYRLLRDARFKERSVSTIAMASGFGDLSWFNLAFRRRFGMTPSALRALTAVQSDPSSSERSA